MAGRRLTLSPIGFDVILALSQAPDGLRLAELSHLIGSPVSSVQTALRVLSANDIVRRIASEPPRYRLAEQHPAARSLAATATVIGDAARSIGLLLRASPAVAWAAVDPEGFVAALHPEAEAANRATLEQHLAMIADTRPGSPGVILLDARELDRLLRVQLDLRARVRAALMIRGRSPVAPTAPPDAGRQAG